MNLKYIVFIIIMFLLTLPVISSSDINETIIVHKSLFLDETINESEINCVINDYEINISENQIIHDNLNESEDFCFIEFCEDFIKIENGYFSNFNYSNESIDNQETDSIISFNSSLFFNSMIFNKIDLENIIFLSSSEEFRFFESNSLNLLIQFVDLCFDNIIPNDLNKDVIICAKKIKGDYIFSIDNLIVGRPFNFNNLTFFTSFFNMASINSIITFNLKILNGEIDEI